ncbi:MAG: response regulator, partial [Candidatus Omnitrophota bacterium]
MGNFKVLLVDDEMDYLKIMGQCVASWGYETILTPSPMEAVEIVREQKPDVIILDYMMPVVDGITALKEIRKIDEKVPVIMLTAYPSSRTMEGAEKLGICAFIPKISPFSDTQEVLKKSIQMAQERLR